MVGALVVDSVASTRKSDRILVITAWSKDTTDESPFVQAINGKMWPFSERFDLAVGDSVHWHVLNATNVLLFSQRGKGDSAIDVLNGGTPADTIRLRAGVTHRHGIVNITIQEEVLGILHSLRDTMPLSWRVVAKDGMTIPPQRVSPTAARLHISPGETLDAELALAAGDYTLDVAAYTKFPVAVRVR